MTNLSVMPGLVPGIPVFLRCRVSKDGDGRDKPGQDGLRRCSSFVLDRRRKLGYIVAVRSTEGRAREAS